MNYKIPEFLELQYLCSKFRVLRNAGNTISFYYFDGIKFNCIEDLFSFRTRYKESLILHNQNFLIEDGFLYHYMTCV